MYTQIVPQLWMLVDREQRNHLAKVFGLVKTGVAEIKDQDVISDGFSQEDLKEITEARMIEYVGSTDSFPRLWELTVAKAKSELNPPIGVIAKPIEAEIDFQIPPATNVVPEEEPQIEDEPKIIKKRKVKSNE